MEFSSGNEKGGKSRLIDLCEKSNSAYYTRPNYQGY